MEDLIIEARVDDYYSPEVRLLAQEKKAFISGESYLEDTEDFYDRILHWLRNYSEVHQSIEFNFRLTYFNTSSFKAILLIFRFLKDYQDRGAEVKINWFYPDDDTDMLREGQDMASGSSMDVNFIPYERED